MTTPPSADLPLITGLDVVGRGVYVRPRQNYSLRDVLFPRRDHRVFSSGETGVRYRVPAGYAVNDSPPMPAGRALNQVVIDESWGRFDKRMSLDSSVTAGTGPVSMDVSAGQTASLRSESEAFYALRSSCVPLWTVYLPDTTRLPAETFDLEVPTPFAHAHRRAYERFFDRFGTHVVRRAWVGGSANLVFNVEKSSGIETAEVRMALTASYGGGASASAAQTREKVLSSSTCTVLGKGGDELALAALSSLDEARYNTWLATVKDNPQVIEIEVQGIWTLIEDEAVATALRDAYREANTFSEVSAVFHHDDHIWFLRGDDYFTYDLDAERSTRPQPLVEKFPGLDGTGFERADAAFLVHDPRVGAKVLYLFRRDRYVQLDPATGQMAEGFPRRIADGWPGVDFDRLDAALAVDARTAYFFCGQRYVRFDLELGKADAGYPQSVPARWVGLNYDRIDAAIYWGNAKVFFFIDDQYVRYDMINCRVDPGFPRYLVGRYVEDWRFFD